MIYISFLIFVFFFKKNNILQLNYRKHYEDTKANIHIPNDMMNHVLAKRCQYILSDLEYRHYFHQWTPLLEEPNVIRARNAQEILSDVRCLSCSLI